MVILFEQHLNQQELILLQIFQALHCRPILQLTLGDKLSRKFPHVYQSELSTVTDLAPNQSP